MREVGYKGPELISQKLAVKMAQYSEGLLRRINILADKMLLSAFADSTHTLTVKHLEDAVKDSGFSSLHPTGKYNNWLWLTGILLVITIIALTFYMGNQYRFFSRHSMLQSQMGGSIEQAEQAVVSRQDDAPVESATKGSVEVESEVAVQPSQPEVIPVETGQQTEQKEKVMRVLETAQLEDFEVKAVDISNSSKKTQQSDAKIDKVTENQAVEFASSSKKQKSDPYEQWIEEKLETSKQWLRQADRQGVSIQVMMLNGSAARELARYLQTEWPLDLDKTYLYEVKMKNKEIFRVFYDEFPTITQGQMVMQQLPKSLQTNSPYLQSIYRMQKALL
jgi:hypothetical protein